MAKRRTKRDELLAKWPSVAAIREYYARVYVNLRREWRAERDRLEAEEQAVVVKYKEARIARNKKLARERRKERRAMERAAAAEENSA